jgi:hypothetical protein
MLAPLDVENVDEVLAQAKAEKAERMAQSGAAEEAAFDRDLQNEIENLEI